MRFLYLTPAILFTVFTTACGKEELPPTIQCGQGTELKSNQCIAKPPQKQPETINCGSGTIRQGNECVHESMTSCGPGTMLQDGRCVPEPVMELPVGIHAFKGTNPHRSLDDLDAFGQMVGDARYVGLGESIHTSGGFYEAKHRLFRYLVEKKGFRVFAFETPWVDADAIRDYVATCQGNLREVMRGGAIFGVFAGVTTAELFKWMCQYNLKHPQDPVHFMGFDTQQPWNDGPALRKYLSDHDSSNETPSIIADLSRCFGSTSTSTLDYYQNYANKPWDQADDTACIAGFSNTESWLANNRQRLETASSTTAYEYAQIHLIGLRAWQGQIRADSNNERVTFKSRDLGMARVFQRLSALRHPHKKVAIWAHNLHLQYDTQVLDFYLHDDPNMGKYLKEDFGDSYQAYGLTAHELHINWGSIGMGLQEQRLDNRSVETRLNLLDRDYLLVDLEQCQSFRSDKRYGLGREGMKMILQDQYRGLVYLKVSRPMSYYTANQ